MLWVKLPLGLRNHGEPPGAWTTRIERSPVRGWARSQGWLDPAPSTVGVRYFRVWFRVRAEIGDVALGTCTLRTMRKTCEGEKAVNCHFSAVNSPLKLQRFRWNALDALSACEPVPVTLALSGRSVPVSSTGVVPFRVTTVSNQDYEG